mgnify:FL=1
MSDCEELIANGQIDEAIEIYKTQQPCTSLILKTIGKLYSDEKADYHLAVYYFQQAFDLEEKVLRRYTNMFFDLSFFFNRIMKIRVIH